MPSPTRRATLACMLGFAALITHAPATMAGQLTFDVKKTASCGCCQAWIDYLRSHGHKVTAHNTGMGALAQLKTRLGVHPKYASCHTATVNGYVVEGHVPLQDIERLLKEKPDSVGLSAPGMPIGSPGMEMGTEREAHDIVLMQKDGSSTVWSHYEHRQ